MNFIRNSTVLKYKRLYFTCIFAFYATLWKFILTEYLLKIPSILLLILVLLLLLLLIIIIIIIVVVVVVTCETKHMTNTQNLFFIKYLKLFLVNKLNYKTISWTKQTFRMFHCT